jgi:Fe-S-cluster containining protein
MWSREYLGRSFALWRRFHLTPLDLGKVTLKVPAGQVPDCENCEELCCTGPNARVSLRLRDIARLADRGHAAHIVKDPTLTIDKRAPWARREADESVFHRVFPALERDKTGTCTFLTEDRTCGAWPDWPLSCARYPYALDLQLKVIFYAKGCASTQTLAPHEAPPRVRALARAVIDSYNERIKDVVTLALAPELLADAGLLDALAIEHWPWRAQLAQLTQR